MNIGYNWHFPQSKRETPSISCRTKTPKSVEVEMIYCYRWYFSQETIHEFDSSRITWEKLFSNWLRPTCDVNHSYQMYCQTDIS